jgi:hypothetical protein
LLHFNFDDTSRENGPGTKGEKLKGVAFAATPFIIDLSERQSHWLDSRGRTIKTAVPLVFGSARSPRHSVRPTIYLKANLQPNGPEFLDF